MTQSVTNPSDVWCWAALRVFEHVALQCDVLLRVKQSLNICTIFDNVHSAGHEKAG